MNVIALTCVRVPYFVVYTKTIVLLKFGSRRFHCNYYYYYYYYACIYINNGIIMNHGKACILAIINSIIHLIT